MSLECGRVCAGGDVAGRETPRGEDIFYYFYDVAIDVFDDIVYVLVYLST